MIRLILYFSIIVTFLGCIPIRVMYSYKYNYYIIDNLTSKSYSENSYKLDNYLLIKVRKAKYNFDTDFLKKEISIVNSKDTMRIYGFFDNHNNYYFNQLNFKKGDYFAGNFVAITKNSTKINGSDLNLSKKNNRIIFEDYNTLPKSRNPKEDKLLKDLKFILIDFSDTINYKLQPITKEEFWDNNFLPKSPNE